MTDRASYPWAEGDALFASELNAAFLPTSSGGTVHGQVTVNPPALATAGYDAAQFITSTAIGSGVNGPATAQIGLNIDHRKVGFYEGTAAVGEIDGLNIMVRQGGVGSDAGGLLLNILGTGDGFYCLSEAVIQTAAPNDPLSTPLRQIHTQEGALPSNTGGYGKVLTALKGSLTTALLISDGAAGTGVWNNALINRKNGIDNLVISDTGTINTAGGVVVNGAIGAAAINVQTNTNATTGAGAYLMWSKAGLGMVGHTLLLNQKQAGSGGFIFGEVDVAGVVTPRMVIDGSGHLVLGALPVNAANDAAASSAGVEVGGLYRNGSVLMVRVA